MAAADVKLNELLKLIVCIVHKGQELIKQMHGTEKDKMDATSAFNGHLGGSQIRADRLQEFVEIWLPKLSDPKFGAQVAELYAMIAVLNEYSAISFANEEFMVEEDRVIQSVSVDSAKEKLKAYVYKEPESRVEKYHIARQILIKLDLKTTLEEKIAYLSAVLEPDSAESKIIDPHQILPFFTYGRDKTETRQCLEGLLVALNSQVKETFIPTGLKGQELSSMAPA